MPFSKAFCATHICNSWWYWLEIEHYTVWNLELSMTCSSDVWMKKILPYTFVVLLPMDVTSIAPRTSTTLYHAHVCAGAHIVWMPTCVGSAHKCLLFLFQGCVECKHWLWKRIWSPQLSFSILLSSYFPIPKRILCWWGGLLCFFMTVIIIKRLMMIISSIIYMMVHFVQKEKYDGTYHQYTDPFIVTENYVIMYSLHCHPILYWHKG